MPPGLSNLTIGPLGPECLGGCTAVVALSVARPGIADDVPRVPAVPRSLLFDPLSPHTPLTMVALSVPEVGAPLNLAPVDGLRRLGGAGLALQAAGPGILAAFVPP